MRFELVQDKKGMVWDLLLYIPTVAALFSIGAKLWFGEEYNYSYLLMFLAFFFTFAGANRVLKTRLMILPSAPIAFEVSNDTASFFLRNGQRVDILKDLKYYGDYSGRTFGLSGLDGSGRRMQFVFHKGQFASQNAFQDAIKAFRDRKA